MNHDNDLQYRESQYPIHPLFLSRWSPRSFTGEPIDDMTLQSLFEAARWAPSGNNSQPWRFIYAHQGTEAWQRLLLLANEGNQRWAKEASVLALLVSKTSHVRKGDTVATPLRNHSFDTGAAWAYLALQATYTGLITHAIGGFDRDRARVEFIIPEDFHIEILIAIGKQGEPGALPEDIRLRETPTTRKPLGSLYTEGVFKFPDEPNAT